MPLICHHIITDIIIPDQNSIITTTSCGFCLSSLFFTVFPRKAVSQKITNMLQWIIHRPDMYKCKNTITYTNTVVCYLFNGLFSTATPYAEAVVVVVLPCHR